MKKIFPITLVLMLVLSIIPASGAGAAQLQMYPNELTYYDAQIDVMLPRLETFQAQYYEVNGRYYQALTSHTTVPDVPEIPDGIDASPTDQEESLALFWNSFAELPDALAWSFSISTYSGPNGDGYVLNVETVINDETWSKSINYGPASEAWRGDDWYQVVAEEL